MADEVRPGAPAADDKPPQNESFVPEGGGQTIVARLGLPSAGRESLRSVIAGLSHVDMTPVFILLLLLLLVFVVVVFS
jgi:hypothetical protein